MQDASFDKRSKPQPSGIWYRARNPNNLSQVGSWYYSANPDFWRNFNQGQYSNRDPNTSPIEIVS